MSQCFVSMHVVEVLAHACFFVCAVFITVTDNENEDENGSGSCDFYSCSSTQCISSLALFLCALYVTLLLWLRRREAEGGYCCFD